MIIIITAMVHVPVVVCQLSPPTNIFLQNTRKMSQAKRFNTLNIHRAAIKVAWHRISNCFYSYKIDVSKCNFHRSYNCL